MLRLINRDEVYRKKKRDFLTVIPAKAGIHLSLRVNGLHHVQLLNKQRVSP